MLLKKCPMLYEAALDQSRFSWRYWTSNRCTHCVIIGTQNKFNNIKKTELSIICRYLYFFEKGNPLITVAAIGSLIELITTEMQTDPNTTDPDADAFFASTMRYIQFQKQKGGAVGERFEPIKAWHSPCHDVA